jgi:5-methyltetrahydrofolate--homocysteine methyltransferase
LETRLLGTGKEVLIGAGHPFCPIGERINPTNKPRLTRAIKEGNWGHLQRMARRQVRAGAKVVDINVGVPGADEAEAMRSAVRAIQEVIDVPISIDSSTIDVLLAGLEVAEGRPLVNSVPAEETYMKRLLPAIKDRDVAMIGMCMRGGANMPTTVEERLQIARTLLDEADKHGIASEDVIIDVLILPIGADHGTGLTTLQSIEQVATELGNNTSVGLSNLSFGMPDRQFLNTLMLAMCIQAGLTAAILDAAQTQIRMAISGSDMIRGFDEYCMRWIAEFRARQAKQAEKQQGAA